MASQKPREAQNLSVDEMDQVPALFARCRLVAEHADAKALPVRTKKPLSENTGPSHSEVINAAVSADASLNNAAGSSSAEVDHAEITAYWLAIVEDWNFEDCKLYLQRLESAGLKTYPEVYEYCYPRALEAVKAPFLDLEEPGRAARMDALGDRGVYFYQVQEWSSEQCREFLMDPTCEDRANDPMVISLCEQSVYRAEHPEVMGFEDESDSYKLTSNELSDLMSPTEVYGTQLLTKDELAEDTDSQAQPQKKKQRLSLVVTDCATPYDGDNQSEASGMIKTQWRKPASKKRESKKQKGKRRFREAAAKYDESHDSDSEEGDEVANTGSQFSVGSYARPQSSIAPSVSGKLSGIDLGSRKRKADLETILEDEDDAKDTPTTKMKGALEPVFYPRNEDGSIIHDTEKWPRELLAALCELFALVHNSTEFNHELKQRTLQKTDADGAHLEAKDVCRVIQKLKKDKTRL